jgi:L-threonylcarbamoyladenylate synthase
MSDTSLIAEKLFSNQFVSYKYFAPTARNHMIIPQTTEALSGVAAVIVRGGVIAFRTDTFYGLGVDPFNPAAVQRIKQLKGREDNKPILVLISDREQIDRLIPKRSEAFDSLADRFWPGPLTIIGEAASKLPNDLTAGTKTVGLRLPDDDRVRALVRCCGGALTATSANLSQEPPAVTAKAVARYFGDLVDLIVDDGAAETDQPSTVVEATRNEVRLIREGLISWSDIRSAMLK